MNGVIEKDNRRMGRSALAAVALAVGTAFAPRDAAAAVELPGIDRDPAAAGDNLTVTAAGAGDCDAQGIVTVPSGGTDILYSDGRVWLAGVPAGTLILPSGTAIFQHTGTNAPAIVPDTGMGQHGGISVSAGNVAYYPNLGTNELHYYAPECLTGRRMMPFRFPHEGTYADNYFGDYYYGYDTVPTYYPSYLGGRFWGEPFDPSYGFDLSNVIRGYPASALDHRNGSSSGDWSTPERGQITTGVWVYDPDGGTLTHSRMPWVLGVSSLGLSSVPYYSYSDNIEKLSVTGVLSAPPAPCVLPLHDLIMGTNTYYSGSSSSYPTHVFAAVGPYAFAGCSNLAERVCIPATVEEIGDSAFRGSGLASLRFADGERISLSYYAFAECARLTDAIIPPGFTNNLYGTFYQCGALTSLVFEAGAGLASGQWLGIASPNLTITVPYTHLESWANALGTDTNALAAGSATWDGNTVRAGGFWTHMTAAEFEAAHAGGLYGWMGNLDGAEVLVHDYRPVVLKVGRDGDNLRVTGCSATEADIGPLPLDHPVAGGLKIADIASDYEYEGVFDRATDSMTSVACYHITGDVVIPGSVTNIGARAFQRCQDISGVIIGDGVKTIGEQAFTEMRSLYRIRLGRSVERIGPQAFYQDDMHGYPSVNYGYKKEPLVLPDSLTSLANLAFYRRDGVSRAVDGILVFPEGLTSLGCQPVAFSRHSDDHPAAFFRGDCPAVTDDYGTSGGWNAGTNNIFYDYPPSVIWVTKEHVASWDASAYTANGPIADGAATWQDIPIRLTGWMYTGGCLVHFPSGWSLNTEPDANGGAYGLIVTGVASNPAPYDAYSYYGRASVELPLDDAIEGGYRITEIASYAFYYASVTNRVVIPDSVGAIGWGAFANNLIAEIVVPASVTNIAANAFSAATTVGEGCGVIFEGGCPDMSGGSPFIPSDGYGLNGIYIYAANLASWNAHPQRSNGPVEAGNATLNGVPVRLLDEVPFLTVPDTSTADDPDDTFTVTAGDGGDPAPHYNDPDDGTVDVRPGNEITHNTGDGGADYTFTVPELPGYPEGDGAYDYDFDPSIPAVVITDGSGNTNAIIRVPSGVIEDGDDGTVAVPGHDRRPGSDDDIVIAPGSLDDIDAHGNVTVGPGDSATHRDGNVFDDGAATVPEGSVITSPDAIVRPGETNVNPTVNSDGAIHVVPGNTIDIDGDGLPPYTVKEPGTYDPGTGIFTPDDPDRDPYPVPPEEGWGMAIESIAVTGENVVLGWPGHTSPTSVISAKVRLDDGQAWDTLTDDGVCVTPSGAVVPRTLAPTAGDGTGYRFFKRAVVPNP
jgi:hypothetical protein